MNKRNFIKSFTACTCLCGSMLFAGLYTPTPHARAHKFNSGIPEKEKTQLCKYQQNCEKSKVTL